MKKTSKKGLIRLNKYISKSGICSRRAADELIQKGKVKVNGELCKELGTKVHLDDKIMVNSIIIRPEKKVYVLLNKPKDFITTRKDTHERKIVFDLIKGVNERVFPVGRLDRNTTGLLLFTNDGDIAKKLTHPSYKIKKIYSVRLEKKITNQEINKIKNGVIIDNEKILVDKIQKLEKNNEIGIEIHIGKNRIVRKIFETLNHKVIKLDRVMFGPLTKKDLPRGTWRRLTQTEIIHLKSFSS